MPIAITDEQLTHIVQAAAPISAELRNEVVEAVMAELASMGEIGDGTVGRAIRVHQRRFFNPPELEPRLPSQPVTRRRGPWSMLG
jgi:hypothetical protein